MDISEKLFLGLNTTVIGMGIVFFVLIILCFIIILESKIFSIAMGSRDETAAAAEGLVFERNQPESIDRKGKTSGEAVLEGVDDETAAVIMAVISRDADIPLPVFKVNSIKALD